VADENAAEFADSAVEDQSSSRPPQDHSPEEQAAEQAVRRAEAELEKARLFYRRARRQAASHLRRIRETTAGDLVNGALKLVKEYPGPSIVVTLALGFFIGRSFRR